MKNKPQVMFAGALLLILVFIAALLAQQAATYPIVVMTLFIVLHFFFPGNLAMLKRLPGDLCFTVFVFLRYLVIPLLMMYFPYNGTIIGEYSAKSHYEQAWQLYIYELVVIEMVYWIFKTRIPKRRRKVDSWDLKSVFSPQVLGFCMIGFVVVAIAVIVIQPSILQRYHSVFSNAPIVAEEDVDSSIGFLILNYIKNTFPVLVIAYYYVSQKKVNWFFVLLPVFVACMFYTSTSRNSILMPGVAYIFVLMKAFPKHAKRLFVILTAFLGAVVLVMTFYKSFYGGKMTSDMQNLSHYLSTYVMGPKEVAIGFATKTHYGSHIGLRTLWNDIINNVPVLSRFGDSTNITGQYYNWTYYTYRFIGGGFIIPAVSQGMLHFGIILAPIFEILKVYALVKLDTLYDTSEPISAFFYAKVAAYFGLFLACNISASINTFIVWIVIPMIALRLLTLLTRPRKPAYETA